MNNDSKLMSVLKAPFPESEIEWRVGPTNADKTKGIALAYITARAVMNRLDAVFGVGGWQDDYQFIPGGDGSKNAWVCRLTVLIDGVWITKADAADESDMESTKGGVSDALKRAAVKLGIGRYLYNLPNVWVPIEMRGKTAYLKGRPKLPAWALPAMNDDEPAPEPVEGDATEPESGPTRNEAELISEPETVVKDKPDATKSGKKWSRPFTPESLKEALWVKAQKISNPANEAQTKLFTALWMEYFGKRDDERRLVQEYLFGNKSLKGLDGRMLAAMLDWLKPEKSPDGSGMYVISKLALQELAAVVKFVTEANGQVNLL